MTNSVIQHPAVVDDPHDGMLAPEYYTPARSSGSVGLLQHSIIDRLSMPVQQERMAPVTEAPSITSSISRIAGPVSLAVGVLGVWTFLDHLF